jgi:hypothetical protein
MRRRGNVVGLIDAELTKRQRRCGDVADPGSRVALSASRGGVHNSGSANRLASASFPARRLVASIRQFFAHKVSDECGKYHYGALRRERWSHSIEKTFCPFVYTEMRRRDAVPRRASGGASLIGSRRKAGFLKSIRLRVKRSVDLSAMNGEKGPITAASALEIVTGAALVVDPSLFARLLFDEGLDETGTIVGRTAGLVLVRLAIGCWSRLSPAVRPCTPIEPCCS